MSGAGAARDAKHTGPGQWHAASECHRLARWMLTLAATPWPRSTRPNATGLPGGCLRLPLPLGLARPVRMPPACPVDAYARRYRRRPCVFASAIPLAWLVDCWVARDCNDRRLARTEERDPLPGKPVAFGRGGGPAGTDEHEPPPGKANGLQASLGNGRLNFAHSADNLGD